MEGECDLESTGSQNTGNPQAINHHIYCWLVALAKPAVLPVAKTPCSCIAGWKYTVADHERADVIE